MKYYIYRISKITGRKEYKGRKTLEIWFTSKERCWQFSEGGAKRYIKRQSERDVWHFEYGIEGAEI